MFNPPKLSVGGFSFIKGMIDYTFENTTLKMVQTDGTRWTEKNNCFGLNSEEMTFHDWVTETICFTWLKVSYNNNKWDLHLSHHNSILSLTFDMQIDTVTMLMEWMDFSVTQPTRFNDTLINYFLNIYVWASSQLDLCCNYSIFLQKCISWKPCATYFDIALMWSIFSSDCIHPKGVSK